MNNSSLAKAFVLMLVLSLTILVSWELYVRSKGFDLSFDDNPALWASKRAMVYEPANEATVFIGASRIKFDLDINTWQNATENHAIQLACVGSNPMPVLVDLAEDENFKGKVVVDVTEPIFFSTSKGGASTPDKNIKYYKDQTLAQRASFLLNTALESQLVFLDKDRLSMNAQLDNLKIPNRPNVFQFPIFPSNFGRVYFDRQEYMTEAFVKDTAQQNQVKNIWDFFRGLSKNKPPTGAKLDSILDVVKKSVDKIKARGGEVLFVRTPSSDPMLAGENMGFPRAMYWDPLLKYTQSPGIHFMDYPAIDHFVCPELSHLSQPDAILFTKEFIRILTEEKGWRFPKRTQAAN